MNSIRIHALVGTVALLAAPARSQTTPFHDDFEGPTLNSFWTPFAVSGFITFPSTVRAHSGQQSVQCNSTVTALNKQIDLWHPFPQPVYGSVSVWIYDTGAGVLTSNYISLIASPFGASCWDYDLGVNNGGVYYGEVPGSSTPISSGVRRTQAWHHLEIDSLPTRSAIRVDGVTAYSGPGGSPFTQVVLRLNAPNWRPAWEASFDDFTFTPAMASTYSLFGAGCAGSAGVPTLLAPASGPQVGATFALTIQSLQITSAVFGILGISNTSLGGVVPLPLNLGGAGMPGCQLLVSTEWIGFVGTRPTPGTARWDLPIPQDASLLGGSFYQQAAVLDPGANALGVVLSNGGRGVIGNY